MKQACVVIVSCLVSWAMAYDAHGQALARDASEANSNTPQTHDAPAVQNADASVKSRLPDRRSADSPREDAEQRGGTSSTPHASGDADDSRSNNDALAGFVDYEEALIHAENAFAFGDYETVIQTLGPWLYPQPRRNASTLNTIHGYMWLGASAWFTDNLEDAERYFTAGLLQHPTMALDPMVFPPALINFFNTVRDDLDLQLPDDRNGDDGNTLYIESRVSEHPIWVSMLPFGYGMFVNNKPEWGAFYALTEGALLTVSTVTFWANYAKRLPSDDPDHPMGYADPERAKMRKRLHIATGATFLGIVVINAIHGALVHKQTRQVQYRTLSAPPEGFDSAERSERSRQSERNQNRWNIRVGPFSNFPRAPLSTW